MTEIEQWIELVSIDELFDVIMLQSWSFSGHWPSQAPRPGVETGSDEASIFNKDDFPLFEMPMWLLRNGQ